MTTNHLTSVAISIATEDQATLYEITDLIVNAFKKIAKENSIHLTRGTRGNSPRIKDTIKLLLNLWNAIPSDGKNVLINDFTTTYTKQIIASRTEQNITGEEHARSM